MKRTAAVGTSLLAAALLLAALLLLLGGDPPHLPSTPPRDPELPLLPDPPPQDAPPLLPAPPARAPSQPFLASGLAPEDLLYPEGVEGPVVVGTVARAGDPDPDCWLALESEEDPDRPDPSEVEALAAGGFRLTRFPPGRYRVRARMDGAAAVYSQPFEARDGAVTDAGHLRLQGPGAIAGVVLDPGGGVDSAEVRLFGRDAATLEGSVVETARSIGRQGFQLAPHEAGEFRLAAAGEGGYAVVAGRTDAAGLGWVEVRLLPWARLEVSLGEAVAARGGRLRRMEVAPVAAPDLGDGAGERSYNRAGAVERLAAGRWRVTLRWTETAPWGEDGERSAAGEFEVAPGATLPVVLPPEEQRGGAGGFR